MSSATTDIPYEKQSDEITGRACGAACLSMAYRSFGVEVPQTEIWPLIAKRNQFGHVSSTSYLMTQDVLNRGFQAVAIQARHPLQALRLCHAGGIRAILNHRVRSDSAAGHYTALVDIDAKDVVIHDPLFAASRRLSHAELIELWLPQIPNSEIVGGVMIAIGNKTSIAMAGCEFCRTPMPKSVLCPQCGKHVGLEPGAVLGCVKDGCIARMWNWICCPACDYVFTLKPGEAAGIPVVAAPPSSARAPFSAGPVLDIAKAFAEVDKFVAHILDIPGAADHPDVKKQVESIRANQEKFKVVHAEDTLRRAAMLGQLAEATSKIRQQREEQRKKMEALNAPAPPLDGDALGYALFKTLGFQ